MAADEKVFSGRLELKNLHVQSLQSLTDGSKRLRVADRSCHVVALDSTVLEMATRVRRQLSRLLRPPREIVKKITSSGPKQSEAGRPCSGSPVAGRAKKTGLVASQPKPKRRLNRILFLRVDARFFID